MFSTLKDVVGVMDMDGFTISKKFYCKELGLIKVGDVAAKTYFFDLGMRWSELHSKDKKTCDYVMRLIHKLPFGVPPGVKAIALSALEATVVDCYHEVRQSEKSVVAYKGGHIERDLLRNLGIPSLNLECFGCPKAEGLIRRMIWLETCGNHTTRDAYWHCQKVEVEAYGRWLEKVM